MAHDTWIYSDFYKPAPCFNAVDTGGCDSRSSPMAHGSIVEILAPGEHHANILFEPIENVGVAGNLTSDAHLAAIAIEYQAELVSTDTDFGRLRGLLWFNPAPLN